jgi:hypothetical protein
MRKAQHDPPLAAHARVAPALRSAGRRPVRTRRDGCVLLAALASLGLGEFASAESVDRWQPLPDVGLLESVVLRIHWFRSAAELRDAAKNSGQETNEIDRKGFDLKGFSLLKRNTKTGEYVCDVYVLKMAGGLVDRDRTTTFGHEVLHCLGLRHD